jgi:hypothetical protein
MGIEKPADHHVSLSGAAMPRAKFEAFEANVAVHRVQQQLAGRTF